MEYIQYQNYTFKIIPPCTCTFTEAMMYTAQNDINNLISFNVDRIAEGCSYTYAHTLDVLRKRYQTMENEPLICFISFG